MKPIGGTPRLRHLPALAALISICPAADASDCKLVNAQLEVSIRFCDESPVGLCAGGTIQSGLLAGEFSAVRDAIAPGAGLGTVSPRVVAYSADAVVTTAGGELRLRHVGVSDPDNRSLIELAEIVAGSGQFAGASGVLHLSGRLDSGEVATRYRGKISGRYCVD